MFRAGTICGLTAAILIINFNFSSFKVQITEGVFVHVTSQCKKTTEGKIKAKHTILHVKVNTTVFSLADSSFSNVTI